MSFLPLPGSPADALPPPPSYAPPMPFGPSYIIDCIHNFTYIWLWNGDSFWYYPTRVEYGEVSGYRWSGQFWFYYGLDPRFIRSVSCPPIPTLY